MYYYTFYWFTTITFTAILDRIFISTRPKTSFEYTSSGYGTTNTTDTFFNIKISIENCSLLVKIYNYYSTQILCINSTLFISNAASLITTHDITILRLNNI